MRITNSKEPLWKSLNICSFILWCFDPTRVIELYKQRNINLFVRFVVRITLHKKKQKPKKHIFISFVCVLSSQSFLFDAIILFNAFYFRFLLSRTLHISLSTFFTQLSSKNRKHWNEIAKKCLIVYDHKKNL